MHGKLEVVRGSSGEWILVSKKAINSITEDDLGDWVSGLDREFNVQAVDLHGTRMGDDCVAILVSALLRTVNLMSIDLSSNQIGDHAMFLLAETVVTALPYLTHVDFSNNHIGPQGCCTFAKSFFPDFSDTENPQSVSTSPCGSRNSFSFERSDRRDSGVRQSVRRSRALLPHGTVYFLDMSDNYVGPEGCFAIAEQVKCNRCFGAVRVRNVQCDSAGALALAATHDLIQSLDLSENFIPDLCVVESVARSLRLSLCLEEVFLSHILSGWMPSSLAESSVGRSRTQSLGGASSSFAPPHHAAPAGSSVSGVSAGTLGEGGGVPLGSSQSQQQKSWSSRMVGSVKKAWKRGSPFKSRKKPQEGGLERRSSGVPSTAGGRGGESDGWGDLDGESQRETASLGGGDGGSALWVAGGDGWTEVSRPPFSASMEEEEGLQVLLKREFAAKAVRILAPAVAISRLRILALSGNYLTDESLGVLCNAVANELDRRGEEKDREELRKQNERGCWLEELDLSLNSLSDLSALAALMRKGVAFRVLDLSGNAISDESAMCVLSASKESHSLVALSFAWNAHLSDRTAVAVAECANAQAAVFLEQRHAKLLASEDRGEGGNQKEATGSTEEGGRAPFHVDSAFVPLPADGMGLQNVDLAGTRVGDAGAGFLSESLLTSGCPLRYVDLSQTRVGREGADTLRLALKERYACSSSSSSSSSSAATEDRGEGIPEGSARWWAVDRVALRGLPFKNAKQLAAAVGDVEGYSMLSPTDGPGGGVEDEGGGEEEVEDGRPSTTQFFAMNTSRRVNSKGEVVDDEEDEVEAVGIDALPGVQMSGVDAAGEDLEAIHNAAVGGGPDPSWWFSKDGEADDPQDAFYAFLGGEGPEGGGGGANEAMTHTGAIDPGRSPVTSPGFARSSKSALGGGEGGNGFGGVQGEAHASGGNPYVLTMRMSDGSIPVPLLPPQPGTRGKAATRNVPGVQQGRIGSPGRGAISAKLRKPPQISSVRVGTRPATLFPSSAPAAAVSPPERERPSENSTGVAGTTDRGESVHPEEREDTERESPKSFSGRRCRRVLSDAVAAVQGSGSGGGDESDHGNAASQGCHAESAQTTRVSLPTTQQGIAEGTLSSFQRDELGEGQTEERRTGEGDASRGSVKEVSGLTPAMQAALESSDDEDDEASCVSVEQGEGEPVGQTEEEQ
uniref:Uncharacterized protein n=1 Tax=Chromera velia CCMP2878 TaxID=1169474 RepID=A0A0G4FX90_9ALVE|eukprot:Cvel_19231.t1-p1 / transcript=Cvel_19231.t1 / gene=Cvel_19231 / organism=Chromera_velia_CCMP2878 / gene_product=hypothetical protein / transcript_product=hypothetical protein / location=Cvel_scaffold1644:643-19564(+) / protein_length=1187 / sequence_SO=supercontig / SO=protein_coding / is_pseudo=false